MILVAWDQEDRVFVLIWEYSLRGNLSVIVDSEGSRYLEVRARNNKGIQVRHAAILPQESTSRLGETV
jgi:hypothetical protein